MKLAALRRIRRTTPDEVQPAARPTPGLRLRVLLHRHRIDEQLAEGSGRGRPAELALRASQLCERRSRSRLARGLRRIVARTENPGNGWLRTAIPMHRPAVVQWREGLLGLAERLERPEAMSASAVARVQLLLCDGTGPLFNSGAPRSLGAALWWVADAWEQECSAHHWRCPIVSKLDIDHVTWTCAHCGATAISVDAATRPT